VTAHWPDGFSAGIQIPGRTPEIENTPMSTTLLRQVSEIREGALAGIRSAATVADLDAVRREVVGKQGTLPGLRRGVGALPPDDRRTVGAAIHEAQQAVTAAIEAREQELLDTEPALPRTLDVTRPGLPSGPGGLHPTIQLMYDLNDAFAALNFDRYAGPEISSELYEFDDLNFPPEHPARESMDTFWLSGMLGRQAGDRLCLRPHLTGGSVRYMQEHEPPFRFVYPGRAPRTGCAAG
jgi:phenylalanyl-tRNA synthetase alpha chain